MITLGYQLTPQNAPAKIGFIKERIKQQRTRIITDDSDSHLLTIAPTGAGKGRSNIIPACLTYPGSLIIIDVKGEAARVTAEARKKFGKVYIVDPFHVVTQNPDKFNPMDIIIDNKTPDQAGVMLAKAFQGEGNTVKSDPFWDNKALELITALTIHELTKDKKSFTNIRKTLFKDDVDYELAVLLDTKKVTSTFAYELISAYLQITSDKTRPCILTTAQQYVALLGDPSVADCLDGPTSFDVQELLSGKPTTIYFVIPPNKLKAYSTLLKLWVTSLIYLLTERTTRPATKTLMILDECSNLGALESLVTAITLLRSYGLKVWCFFQSVSQLKSCYPSDWSTIFDNCNVIQTFGINKYHTAKEMADMLGNITPVQILSVPCDQAILLKPYCKPEIIKKMDYLKDKKFQKMGYNPNTFYTGERF